MSVSTAIKYFLDENHPPVIVVTVPASSVIFKSLPTFSNSHKDPASKFIILEYIAWVAEQDLNTDILTCWLFV